MKKGLISLISPFPLRDPTTGGQQRARALHNGIKKSNEVIVVYRSKKNFGIRTRIRDVTNLNWPNSISGELNRQVKKHVEEVRRTITNSNITIFITDEFIDYEILKLNPNYIIDFHDFQASHYIENHKIEVVRNAKKVFVTTSIDQFNIKKTCNVDAILIPNASSSNLAKFYSKYTKRKYANPGKGYSAIFVGSNHQPNIEALDRIITIAKFRKEWKFIIVGEVSKTINPSRTIPKNVQLMGRVSQRKLAKLYFRSKVAIMPITEGTGSSIKFIEALACEKIIICNSHAARGPDLEPGRDYLQAETLEEFVAALDFEKIDAFEKRLTNSNRTWEEIEVEFAKEVNLTGVHVIKNKKIYHINQANVFGYIMLLREIFQKAFKL